MDATIVRAVERAIDAMRANLDERVTVDDLARAAMFSKFHFSRIFQRATGLSPGRFLSALRLDEAKRLLLTTSITVADIGHRVGYHSVGTFSSRFRCSVGVSPIFYRQLGGVVPAVPVERATKASPAQSGTTIRGRVHGSPADRLGIVFVGLFRGRILEGAPARFTVLRGPGPYALADVPSGTWYVGAYATATIDGDSVRPYLGCHGPIVTRADAAARLADIRLRQPSLLDPPLLVALPDLGSDAVLDVAV
jgi:AraC-like DNA-binding protein